MVHQNIFFLGLLHTQPLSGQHIYEIVQRQTPYFGKLIEPQSVLTELEHLAQRNYLSKNALSLSPAQRTYRLTETGLHYFHNLINEGLQIYVPLPGAADSSLLLLRYLATEDVIALFTSRHEQLKQAYTRIARLYIRRFPNNEAHSIVYDHLCTLLHAEMRWTDELIQQIRSEASNWRLTSPRLHGHSAPIVLPSAVRLNDGGRRDVRDIIDNLLEVRSLGLSRADFALYFLPTLEPEQATDALQERIGRVEQILNLLMERQEQQRSEDAFSHLIYEWRINLLEAERNWLERLIIQIGNKDILS